MLLQTLMNLYLEVMRLKKQTEIYCCIENAWRDWGSRKKAVENYEKAIETWVVARGEFSDNIDKREMVDIHVAEIYSVL